MTAPFDWLAQGMGGAAEWMFTSVWKVIDTTTYVDVTSGEYTKVYNIMFGVGVFVMLGFFMLQVIGGMIRREPAALSRAALGLAKSILGSFVALALLATALEITDQLCIGIVNAAGTNMNEMGDKVAVLAAGLGAINLNAPGAGAILTIFLSSLAIVGAMVVWISLLIRKALLLIAIVFAPIALAGASWDHTRTWLSRWATFVIAMILSKVVLVVIFPARHRPGLGADRCRPGVREPADGRRRPDAHGRLRAVPDLQGDRVHGLRHVPRDVSRTGGQGLAQPADADPALAPHRQRAHQDPRGRRWRYDDGRVPLR
ncbi:type IV secretion system protein [Nocardioides sp. TF02-7]|uniref:type IV secretion system protein n=1 Tax=Nocardioides sp. TF02-7 TaxID=2917724 RepID=UPI001F052058|nr:type IV secretion system protein [Nocardioides sp. TF02-7]UMG92230.1 type IV secretion system protein [Nocardioides sp. TF02-7]